MGQSQRAKKHKHMCGREQASYFGQGQLWINSCLVDYFRTQGNSAPRVMNGANSSSRRPAPTGSKERSVRGSQSIIPKQVTDAVQLLLERSPPAPQGPVQLRVLAVKELIPSDVTSLRVQLPTREMESDPDRLNSLFPDMRYLHREKWNI